MEDDLDIPRAWQDAADRIRAGGWRTVLVLGQTDTGKSTLCRYIGARLLDAGTGIALVDADVGQKTVGPPATVTLGRPETPHAPSRMPTHAFYFVGSTDPIRGMTPLVIGAARLAGAADRPVVLVDTPGVVRGPGQVLQGWLIESVRPDLILAVEEGRELTPILDAHRHCRILRLPRPSQAKRKSASVRTAARDRAFATYFAGAAEHRLDLGGIALQRMPRAAADGLDPDLGRSRLYGVADRDGEGVGLAILRAIDPVRRTATLTTPAPPERIAALQFGSLHIDRDGHQLRDEAPVAGRRSERARRG